MGNRQSSKDFRETVTKVETEVGKYQLRHGLQDKDLQCFQNIYYNYVWAYLKHIVHAGIITYYFVGDVDPKTYRNPVQHTIVKGFRSLRFFPNIRHEGLRIVAGLGVLSAYFLLVPTDDYLRINVRKKVQLETPYGKYYRQTLYKVDPESKFLRNAPKDYFDLEDNEELKHQNYLPLSREELEVMQRERRIKIMNEAKQKLREEHQERQRKRFGEQPKRE